jgi:hypothetical protein
MAKTALGFLCIFMTVGLVTSRIERLWANKTVVRPGESIVLTCEFSDFDDRDTTVFYKHLPINRTVALTNNYDLADNVDANRFKIEWTETDVRKFATKTFSILNAGPGDSGNYSCFMRDIDKNKATYQTYIEISVEVEPSTIKLFLDDIEVYNGTNSVPIKFLQARKLRCETTRSNPGANITITTGNGKRVHLTNLTVSNATYQMEEKNPTYDYIVPVYRNTTALVDKWVFDTDAYDKPVVCLAKVNTDATGIMTSFIPFLADGPPEIECNDTFFARDGQRNFVITCVAYAKPAITKATFYFTKNGAKVTIEGLPFGVEHSSADGKFKGTVEKFDNIKSFMRLKIDTVDLKAGIPFNFLVDNGQGQDIHGVVIKDPSFISSSTTLSTCLVTLLFIWLVGVGIRDQL